ncbi:MAG: hypothetical protein WDO19_07465 [Bacteroidota bacterium]
MPGYKDVIQLKDQALDRVGYHIVINNIRQQFGAYSINGSFLENDILNNLNSIGRKLLLYLLHGARSPIPAGQSGSVYGLADV